MQTRKYCASVLEELERTKEQLDFQFWEKKAAIVFEVYQAYYAMGKDLRKRICSEHELWKVDYKLPRVSDCHLLAEAHLDPSKLKEYLGMDPETEILTIEEAMENLNRIRNMPLQVADLVRKPVCVSRQNIW